MNSMGAKNFTLVSPDSAKGRYEQLIPKWWKWVFTKDRDSNYTFDDLSFLRDDIVGPQLMFGAGQEASPISKPFKHTIKIDAHTSIFFPVYHVHIVEGDPFRDGKKCVTIPRCVIAAENDLANVYERWATIDSSGGNPQPITTNFTDFEVKFGPFKLDVPDDHDMKREKGYSLPGGPHNGVAHGTFLLLDDFQPGKYEIDFGGKATNYQTRSVYKMTVS